MLRKLGVLAAVVLVCGCGFKEPGLREYKATRLYFGTYVTIHCFYPAKTSAAGKEAVKKSWERMDEIQERMNPYAQTGDISELNRSGLSGARVHPDVYRLLEDSARFSWLTKGAFDVTIFPLVELWKDAAGKGRFPDDAAVAAAKEKVGYEGLRFIEPDRVVFNKPGMRVDLGGLIPGYAADEVTAILWSYGMRDFLVDSGGEVVCRGKFQGREPWRVAIRDPRDKSKVLKVIELEDRAISTSGSYEKFYVIAGKQFSHIIDPLTGYPAAEAISVTVIAPTCEEADALSTAFCVMGKKKAEELLSRLDAVEAIIIE